VWIWHSLRYKITLSGSATLPANDQISFSDGFVVCEVVG
jgi:hypothetical protein